MNLVFDAYQQIGRAMAEAELVAEIARLDEAMSWYCKCGEGTLEQRDACEAMRSAADRCIKIGRAANLAALVPSAL